MAIKRNVTKVDLCSYPHFMLLAPRKFGKTTFWSRLVREAWGSDENGLLVSFGKESGFHSLNGLQYEECKAWDEEEDEDTGLRGFVQVVDELIENKEELGIKGVCLDTFDEMVQVCTKEVLRQHKKEKGTVCKTLNEAFSGYGRGVTRLNDLISRQIERLRDAGYAVFILCHIKNKEKTDLKSGETFEQITNNLQDNIYSNLADTAQMVMVGVLDREISNGRIVNEERVIYLRGTSEIDAGSRFNNLPEKIELSPKAFLKAFEQGVKGSLGDKGTDDTIAKMKAEEEKRIEKASKIARDKEKQEKVKESNEELVAKIQELFSNADLDTKDAVKAIMAENSIKNFKNPEELPTSALEVMISILSK